MLCANCNFFTQKRFDMAISNEIGKKGRYSILQNAAGEIMLMMNSRMGGPENPRFIYDGGEVALLYRSQESSDVFLTENVAGKIDNDEVEREYIVPVRLVRDISSLIVS